MGLMTPRYRFKSCPPDSVLAVFQKCLVMEAGFNRGFPKVSGHGSKKPTCIMRGSVRVNTVVCLTIDAGSSPVPGVFFFP